MPASPALLLGSVWASKIGRPARAAWRTTASAAVPSPIFNSPLVKTSWSTMLALQRTAGNDAAIADAVARVDDDQRIVDVDARALEAVVHDQEIAAVLFQQQPGAGGAIRRHRHRRMLGQKQRLVADMPGAVVMRHRRHAARRRSRHGRATGSRD